MKGILIILLLAIGGYAAWQQKTTRETVARADARVVELESELNDTKAQLKDTARDLAKAEKGATTIPATSQSTSARKANMARTASADAESDPALAAEVAAATPVVDKRALLNSRLEELRTIYEGHRGKFDEKRATLTSNIAGAKARHSALESNPPVFDEQGSRFDSRGNRIGASGVRTSQSDREREMAKHTAQVAQAAGLMGSAEAEMVTLQAEMDKLERAYKDAVEKARDEAGN